eukprot:TRINITY_DN14491_c0_g1_i2.p1 TRINITY_DN14491_c0_g1~~TRINITY_DN14491_c0_g1_i2.p1  ORF type:complete len:308 (+),score=44.98 TRINITY_DN14491_c0_g1_i2:110-1033(+)
MYRFKVVEATADTDTLEQRCMSQATPGVCNVRAKDVEPTLEKLPEPWSAYFHTAASARRRRTFERKQRRLAHKINQWLEPDTDGFRRSVSWSVSSISSDRCISKFVLFDKSHSNDIPTCWSSEETVLTATAGKDHCAAGRFTATFAASADATWNVVSGFFDAFVYFISLALDFVEQAVSNLIDVVNQYIVVWVVPVGTPNLTLISALAFVCFAFAPMLVSLIVWAFSDMDVLKEDSAAAAARTEPFTFADDLFRFFSVLEPLPLGTSSDGKCLRVRLFVGLLGGFSIITSLALSGDRAEIAAIVHGL